MPSNKGLLISILLCVLIVSVVGLYFLNNKKTSPTNSTNAASTSHKKSITPDSMQEATGLSPTATVREKIYSEETQSLTPAADERALIDAWIKENNLNIYGDQKGTAYMGGTPLFNELSGIEIDKYQYIIARHPEKPWMK